MIEKVNYNIVRCDVCTTILKEGDIYTRVFQKDICCKCMVGSLKKLEANRIISETEFSDIVEEVSLKI